MNKKNIQKRAHEKGFILAVAMMVIVVMLIMAMPFLFKLSAQYRTTERSFKSLSAFNLAEAGVERAIYELNNGYMFLPWTVEPDGTLKTSMLNFAAADGKVIGDINVDILPPAGATGDETRFVESQGQISFIANRTVDKEVRVLLEAEYGSIFKFAVFADEGIYMASNVRVDSYNTKENLIYDEKTSGNMGHVGSNTTITPAAGGGIYLSSQDELMGRVACGYGTAPKSIDNVIDTNTANTYVDGGKFILGSPFNMTPDPPISNFTDSLDFNPAKPGILAKSKGGPVVLNETNSGIYNSFVMDVGSTVKIQGNVTLYITGVTQSKGEFLMKNNTTVEIEPGSSLKLILGNTSFQQLSNTEVNNLTKTAENLVILGTEQFTGEMHWNSNTALYGAIFVPEAAIHYDSNHDLYGSLVCNWLDFNSNANIHYDEALGNLDWISAGLPTYVVKYWQQVGAGV